MESKDKKLESKDECVPTKNKDINSTHTYDYSNSGKWYVERMKNIYEQMMEHEFKWLENEKKNMKKLRFCIPG